MDNEQYCGVPEEVDSGRRACASHARDAVDSLKSILRNADKVPEVARCSMIPLSHLVQQVASLVGVFECAVGDPIPPVQPDPNAILNNVAKFAMDKLGGKEPWQE